MLRCFCSESARYWNSGLARQPAEQLCGLKRSPDTTLISDWKTVPSVSHIFTELGSDFLGTVVDFLATGRLEGSPPLAELSERSTSWSLLYSIYGAFFFLVEAVWCLLVKAAPVRSISSCSSRL